MTILVTGASGFVGSRLVRALRARRGEEALVAWGHEHRAGPDDGVVWRKVDMTDEDEVHAAVADARPDVVFHLAAVSSVGDAWVGPKSTYASNVDATMALADAVRRLCPGSVVIFASSGEIYGLEFQRGNAVTEASPVLPANAYARSKLAAEILLQDTLSDVCPVIALRLLNHTGPGQDERFVVPSFAAQIARIEAGLLEPRLRVGNLASERDFLDVNDVIEAYLKILQHSGTASGFHVFNVASGHLRSIASILDQLRALSTTDFEIEVGGARARAVDVPRTLCDSTAFRERFGWRPSRSLDDTLREILESWRVKVRGGR